MVVVGGGCRTAAGFLPFHVARRRLVTVRMWRGTRRHILSRTCSPLDSDAVVLRMPIRPMRRARALLRRACVGLKLGVRTRARIRARVRMCAVSVSVFGIEH